MRRCECVKSPEACACSSPDVAKGVRLDGAKLGCDGCGGGGGEPCVCSRAEANAFHCMCLIHGPNRRVEPCACSTLQASAAGAVNAIGAGKHGHAGRRPAAAVFHCMCLVEGSDGKARPCGCNSKRAFLGDVTIKE